MGPEREEGHLSSGLMVSRRMVDKEVDMGKGIVILKRVNCSRMRYVR